MRFLIYFSQLLLLFSNSAFGQQNLSAKITRVDGDTLVVTIKYKAWNESPNIIQYRLTSGEPFQLLEPVDIKSIFIESVNEYYEGLLIPQINISSDIIYHQRPTIEPKDSIWLFVQKLVSGPKLELYKYVNDKKKVVFLVKKDGKLEELINYNFTQQIRDKNYIFSIAPYEEQLNAFCNEFPDFIKHSVPYEEAPLVKYLLKYNQCFLGETITYISDKEPKETFDLSINSGVDFGLEPTKPNAIFTFGAQLRINFPRKFQNQFLRIGINVMPDGERQVDFWNSKIEIANLYTSEVTIGTYIGGFQVRPMISTSFFALSSKLRQNGGFAGFINLGISYKRKIDLEFGHVVNAFFISKTLPVRPKIAVHYYFNPFPKKPKNY